jgi:outer membrane protein assembly factor BamB
MIRFRIGQSWKRERALRPVDAFGLELDGVNLLAGASEEPLDRVVVDLLGALESLVTGAAPFAEVALPEAHLELVLRRRDAEVHLEVVSLARPARRVRGPVRLDLEELVTASVRCASALLHDVREAAPALEPKLRRSLSARARRLERARVTSARRGRSETPFERTHSAAGDPGFGFQLFDEDGRLGAFTSGTSSASLGTLLIGGRVWLEAGGEVLWSAQGTPFLLALEIARQGADLVHALELEESSFSTALAGAGRIELELGEGVLRAGGRSVRVPPESLARAMFELGQALAIEVTQRSRSQARNAWVRELVDRCREGMVRVGTAIRPPTDARAAGSRTKRAPDKPLRTAGRLRRLRFERLWQKQNVAAGEGARLLLGRRGPMVASAGLAIGFSAAGEVLFRRTATHGVALSPDGYAISATLDQVFGYSPGSTQARWFREHDGLPIGPELVRKDGVCVVMAQARHALAFSELTGRELWRVSPPRTQRAHLSVEGRRVLLTTDAGYLYGMDLGDGQIRFRMRWPLPFTGPAAGWGRKLVGAAGRSGKSLVVAADAHTGSLAWSRELGMGPPSRPILAAGRVLVAAPTEEDAVLVCLGRSGEPFWERPLHLGNSNVSLRAIGRTVLATSQTGAAVLMSLDGVQQWRVGSAGAELPARIPACHIRGVALVPGEMTRALEPRGGHVLAEVRTGMGLVALAVDARLNLYALDEDGTLSAYRLGAALSLV